MIVPGLGFSIIVHVCIIAWHKFFSWVPKNKNIDEKYATGAMRSFGFAIVILVSVVISTLAFSVIHTSITEEHSSVYLVRGIVSDAYAALARVESQPAANQNPNPGTEMATGTGTDQSMSAANAKPMPMPSLSAADNVPPATNEYATMAQSLELAKDALLKIQERLIAPVSPTP